MTVSVRCDHRGCSRSVDLIWSRGIYSLSQDEPPHGWICSSPADPKRHRCPEHADAWTPAAVPRATIEERLNLAEEFLTVYPDATDAALAAYLAEHGHHVHRRTAQRFRLAADPSQPPRTGKKRANRRDNHEDAS